MKQKLAVMLLAITTILAACGSNQQQANTTDTLQNEAPKAGKPDFSQVVFATTKDTSCGMPLSAGLEDTVQLQGKVYGFCSKECKEEFVTLLKKENKR